MLCPFCPFEDAGLAKHLREVHPEQGALLNRALIDSTVDSVVPQDCIYFIQAGEEGAAIKVGKTSEFYYRFSALQSGIPTTLRTLLLLPGDSRTESLVRKSFEPYHLRGEWFLSSFSLLSFIYEMRGHFKRNGTKEVQWWFRMLRAWFDRNPSPAAPKDIRSISSPPIRQSKELKVPSSKVDGRKNTRHQDRAPLLIPSDVKLPKGFPKHDRALLQYYLEEVVPRKLSR